MDVDAAGDDDSSYQPDDDDGNSNDDDDQGDHGGEDNITPVPLLQDAQDHHAVDGDQAFLDPQPQPNPQVNIEIKQGKTYLTRKKMTMHGRSRMGHWLSNTMNPQNRHQQSIIKLQKMWTSCQGHSKNNND